MAGWGARSGPSDVRNTAGRIVAPPTLPLAFPGGTRSGDALAHGVKVTGSHRPMSPPKTVDDGPIRPGGRRSLPTTTTRPLHRAHQAPSNAASTPTHDPIGPGRGVHPEGRAMSADTPDPTYLPVRRPAVGLRQDRYGRPRRAGRAGLGARHSVGTAKVLADAACRSSPPSGSRASPTCSGTGGHAAPAIHAGSWPTVTTRPSRRGRRTPTAFVGIDLVAVNLYPFSSGVGRLIDIGRPDHGAGAARTTLMSPCWSTPRRLPGPCSATSCGSPVRSRHHPPPPGQGAFAHRRVRQRDRRVVRRRRARERRSPTRAPRPASQTLHLSASLAQPLPLRREPAPGSAPAIRSPGDSCWDRARPPVNGDVRCRTLNVYDADAPGGGSLPRRRSRGHRVSTPTRYGAAGGRRHHRSRPGA